MSIRAKLLGAAFAVMPLKAMFADPSRLARATMRRGHRTRPRPGHRLKRLAKIATHGTVAHPLFHLAPRRRATRAEVLYIHGGAHALEINSLHWGFIGKLVDAGFAVWVPIVPLVPHADGASIREYVCHSYDTTLRCGTGMPITLIADSAGAGLALGLALGLARSVGADPERSPSGMVLISPWLDLSLAAPEVASDATRDPVLDLPGLRWAAGQFAGDRALDDPVVSPLHADLSALPPALVLTGGRDMLRADALRLKAKAQGSAQAVTLIDAPNMLHNWPLLPIPEAAAAFRQIVQFVERTTEAGSSASKRTVPGVKQADDTRIQL